MGTEIEMNGSTREALMARKLARMRLGQDACDFVTLTSDPEVRFAIVPLTEAEYYQALEKVAEMTVPDSLAGAQLQDRRRAQEILVRAIREEFDLTKQVFQRVDELLAVVDVNDIDELVDGYNAMTARSSPSIEGIPPEEFQNLRELLQVMDWNALSGRAWYAAKRFLSEISPSPLLDNSPGSSSISTLTTTKG